MLQSFLGKIQETLPEMDLTNVPNVKGGLLGGMGLGGDDPMGKEMRALYNKPLMYDNNQPAHIVASNAAKKVGINPALFFSSAFQEGFNKAIAKPDEASEAYSNAKIGSDFPVDGFFNYGLDTIGTRLPELIKKGYLPVDFGSKMKTYDAFNEKKEKVSTAAFRNNEDALTAKAAFMRDAQDKVSEWARKKGATLDEDAMNYFTIAAYNSGEGNAQKMFDKYLSAKDKKAWIEKGDSQWQKVHKNLSPRMKNIKLANELLSEKTTK